MYYSDKIESIKSIFGTENITLEAKHLTVDNFIHPIIDDVIILLDPSQYTEYVRERLTERYVGTTKELSKFSESIQYTFGEEWKLFSGILADHKREFIEYFDLIDMASLRELRICDLGSGNGRWSYFLGDKCRELILVDFSDSIFVARGNLRNVKNALFFMGDLKQLPFRNDFCDLIFCLGVLHHLPTDALVEVRKLRKYAPALLVYVYYALDNRPFYYYILFRIINEIRKQTCKVRSALFRLCFTYLAGVLVYLPMGIMAEALKPFGLDRLIPLHDQCSFDLKYIRQQVYDRFFTSIEQRFTRRQIMELKDTFGSVVVSEKSGYWHFLCRR